MLVRSARSPSLQVGRTYWRPPHTLACTCCLRLSVRMPNRSLRVFRAVRDVRLASSQRHYPRHYGVSRARACAQSTTAAISDITSVAEEPRSQASASRAKTVSRPSLAQFSLVLIYIDIGRYNEDARLVLGRCPAMRIRIRIRIRTRTRSKTRLQGAFGVAC